METSTEDKQPSSEVGAIVVVESGAVNTPSKSVVARFLEVRGIERKKPASQTPKITAALASPSATKARIPARTMWNGYSRRRCGSHSDFQRRAMQTPDESFSESIDVYNPKKRQMRFIKIHEEADLVGDEFLYQTRRLYFEREVVDRPVCDLLENRDEYDEMLDHIYDSSDESDDVNDIQPDKIAP